MSMYGPPGGGGHYPGQPQDPWQGGSGDPYGGQPGGNPYGQQPPSDPYGQPSGPPSDPYGQPSGPPADPYGGYGQPSGPPADPYGGYGQPSGPPNPYGQQPGGQWGAPPPPPGGPGGPWGPAGGPPPEKSNTGLVIGLAATAVVLLLVGAVVVFLVMNRDSTPSADPSNSPSPGVSTESPTPEETTETPTDEPTKTDLNDVAEGDCLYDSDPSDTSASLEYVSCEERGKDHYKVLKRFDDTQDADKCEDVPGYETSFTSSSGNFVICTDELN